MSSGVPMPPELTPPSRAARNENARAPRPSEAATRIVSRFVHAIHIGGCGFCTGFGGTLAAGARKDAKSHGSTFARICSPSSIIFDGGGERPDARRSDARPACASEAARNRSGGDQAAVGEGGTAMCGGPQVVRSTHVRNARRDGCCTSSASSHSSLAGPITTCFTLPRHRSFAPSSSSIGSTSAA